MPNWTSSRIYIEGEPADIRAFLEAVKWEDWILDFDRIIPMPEPLKGTVSGFNRIDGKEVSSWKQDMDAEGKAFDRLFTADEQRDLEKIGFFNWYDWCCATWGTKWNASHPRIEDDTLADGYLEIFFETAWSAPVPVFLKLREMFPTLTFECRWRYEDDHPFPHSLDDIG